VRKQLCPSEEHWVYMNRASEGEHVLEMIRHMMEVHWLTWTEALKAVMPSIFWEA